MSAQPWRRLRVIARQSEPKLRRAIIRALGRVQNGTQFAAMRAAYARGDIDDAVNAVPWARLTDDPTISTQVERVLREQYLQTTEAAARSVGVRLGERNFTVVDDAPIDAARAHAARLLTNTAASGKEAVRVAVVAALEQGLSAQRAARIIKPAIGLTAPHAAAVANLMDKLTRAGWSTKEVDAEGIRYARQLHQVRALMVARTETGDALIRGQRAAWDAAATEGLFDPTTARRQWVASTNACPLICQPLDGQEIGYAETAWPGGYSDPPAHPSCACVVQLLLD